MKSAFPLVEGGDRGLGRDYPAIALEYPSVLEVGMTEGSHVVVGLHYPCTMPHPLLN